MDLKETIRRILKGVAKKLSNKLHCDRHGSCVHFAELFVEEINNTHPELLKEFEVIEGYVDVKFGEGKPQEHTWIRLSDDEVIDPTFMQFTKYDKNAKYSRKRTKSYTGQEYYDKGVIESWFSKRREEQPDTVFKGGLEESIRRILREEDFIPSEDLNTVIKDYEGGFDVFIMNGDKKIGEISFIEEDKPNQYTISDATIDDEYKGNRIYPKTIISLFKQKPNIIINSVFRSPEAQKAWIYLLSNLPPNIGKSVKYYKDEDTTLFQLKSRNLQESIRRILREESKVPLSVRRRLPLIDKIFDSVAENVSPCYANSIDHYMEWVYEEFLSGLESVGIDGNNYAIFSTVLQDKLENFRKIYEETINDC